jgi:hypothetical protein
MYGIPFEPGVYRTLYSMRRVRSAASVVASVEVRLVSFFNHICSSDLHLRFYLAGLNPNPAAMNITNTP